MEMEKEMTMIERVAKALADEYFGVGWYDRQGDEFRRRWAFMARAAIEALREPTEAMLDEGPPEPYMEKHVWARMIDAALKEHEG